MKINLREVVIAILIFLVVFAIVQISIGSYRVTMSSMYPTFYGGGNNGGTKSLPNDCVMVDKLTYRFRGPHRGEVVILWPPKDKVSTKNPYIKRVIGLPGETVRVDDSGQVYITKKDGVEFKLVENPEMPACAARDRSWALGKNEYFVLGDNRGDSSDSTYFGAVKRGNFIGKTWLRYWPLSRFGLTPHYSYKLVSPTASTSTTSLALPAIEAASLSASTP